MNQPQANFPTAPFSALVVEPTDADAVSSVCALTSVGFTVTLADNFRQAEALLDMQRPLVLITDVRLGPYNGLQLALHSEQGARAAAVIVTSNVADPVLQQDAERAGATFVVKPVTPSELIAAVYRTALRQANADGSLNPIRAPFERRTRQRRRITPAMLDAERRRIADRRRDVNDLLSRAVLL